MKFLSRILASFFHARADWMSIRGSGTGVRPDNTGSYWD